MLGHDLKVQVHLPKTTASDHRCKFALLDDIPDKDIQDQDVVLKKANYGTPGSDNYRKNMLMAVSSLDGKFGVQGHKLLIGHQARSKMGTNANPCTSRRC